MYQTGVDCLAISYGTKHGANKGSNTVIRKEIVIAIKESLMHEGISGVPVSHGSSTAPGYIADEINALGGDVQSLRHQNRAAKRGRLCCMGKIIVDTDIRLAVTRNLRELFKNSPELCSSATIGAVYTLLQNNPSAFDSRVFLPPPMDTVLFEKAPGSDTAKVVTALSAA